MMNKQQQQNYNIDYIDMQGQQQIQQGQQKHIMPKPFVKVTEQPAGKALRFRYECEGRTAGSIPGVHSTPENKTYPSIEVVGFKGRALVVVSCVTKDPPHRPHPHHLVGKEGCKKGVCTLEIDSDTMRAVFTSLGIQCVKKKEIETALREREEIRVDPFKTGFAHRYQPASIDLNSVRLCFQVFMESEQKGRFTVPLQPIVSDPIYDKKAMSDLVICRLCTCSATVLGDTQIILLCEKVTKEDISVRFFENRNGQTIWEALGEFQHVDVHRQTAITLKTPPYHTLDITESAKVYVQLRRPSDGLTSESFSFVYKPIDSDVEILRRKRQKIESDPMQLLLLNQINKQQKPQQHQHQQQQQQQQNQHRFNDVAMQMSLPNQRQQFSSVAVSGVTLKQPQYKPSGQLNQAHAPPAHQHHQQHQRIPQQQAYSSNSFVNRNNENLNLNNLSRSPRAPSLSTTTNGVGSAVAVDFNAAGRVDGNTGHVQWHQHPVLQHQQPLQQQHSVGMQQQKYVMQVANNVNYAKSGVTGRNNNNIGPTTTATNSSNHSNSNNNNNNNNGPTVSNLLSFDSSQLVRINTEDQQFLRLNTEDLQISDLSIPT